MNVLRRHTTRLFYGSHMPVLLVAVAFAAAVCLFVYRTGEAYHEFKTVETAQGAGVASAPYSDALGPWLHGSMSYYLRGVALGYLYRPTVGLFYNTIITAGNSVKAVPLVWLAVFLAGSTALVFAADGPRRAAITAALAMMALFYADLVRPLNPETLMADFWPMALTLLGIWLIALSLLPTSTALASAAAGFLLVGLGACVRGPQLGAGVLIFVMLGPRWLRQRDWLALAVLPLAFGLPLFIDTVAQHRHGAISNLDVTLYSFYTDGNHAWSPSTHERWLREKPPSAEIREHYLSLVFSWSGIKIVALKCAEVLGHTGNFIMRPAFLLLLCLAGLLGWMSRPRESSGDPAGRWQRHALLGLIAGCAATLLVVHTPLRVALVGLIAIGLTLHAILGGRMLTALLAVSFLGSLLFHAALGLTGGQRVIGNYELLLPAALLAWSLDHPRAVCVAAPSMRWLAAAVGLALIVGYTGGYWLRPAFKADIRLQLSAPQTAMKLSDSPALDRSLYLTGEVGLFYARWDPNPFGTVRHYEKIDAPKGWGNVTFLEPLNPVWSDRKP